MIGETAKRDIFKEMSTHDDDKDQIGLSAIVGSKLSAIPSDRRIEIIGNLALQRFTKQSESTDPTKVLGLVFRNSKTLMNGAISKILEESKFPVAKEKMSEFCDLVRKSRSQNEEEKKDALVKLKSIFDNPPSELIKVVLPFYHAYLEEVREKNGDLEKAKHDFLGQIAFPFVEMKVADLLEEDIEKINLSDQDKKNLIGSANAVRKKNVEPYDENNLKRFTPIQLLQYGLEDLRHNESVMDGLIVKLDEANKDYMPQPLAVSEEEEKALIKAMDDGKKEQKEMIEANLNLLTVAGTEAMKTADLCRELKKAYPKDSSQALELEKIYAEFANAQANLKNQFTLKGVRLSQKDITEHLKMIANRTVDGKPLLHIAAGQGNIESMKALIKAGADVLAVDSNGMTALEVVKGNVSEEEYKELILLANQSLKKGMSITDPEQRQIIRDYFEAQLQGEYFQYFDKNDALEKTYAKYSVNKEHHEKMIQEINNVYKEFLEGSAAPINIYFESVMNVPIKSKDQGMDDKNKKTFPITSKDQIENAMKVLREAKVAAENFLLNDNLSSKAGMLGSKLPLHSFLNSEAMKDEKGKPSRQNDDFFKALLAKNKDGKPNVNLNQKSPEGLTPLQIAFNKGNRYFLDSLLEAGANPKVTTTNYQRSGITRFGDAMKGLFSGKFMKNWKNPPPRTVGQIAELAGNKELAATLLAKEKTYVAPPEPKKPIEKETQIQNEGPKVEAPKESLAEKLGFDLGEVDKAGKKLEEMAKEKPNEIQGDDPLPSRVAPTLNDDQPQPLNFAEVGHLATISSDTLSPKEPMPKHVEPEPLTMDDIPQGEVTSDLQFDSEQTSELLERLDELSGVEAPEGEPLPQLPEKETVMFSRESTTKEDINSLSKLGKVSKLKEQFESPTTTEPKERKPKTGPG